MYRVSPLCAIVLSALILAGCGSSDGSHKTATQSASLTPQLAIERAKRVRSVSAHDLVRRLQSAGLETKSMGAATLSADDLSRFPEPPRSTMVIRVSDGKGNSSPMTFVEFSSAEMAAKLDAKSINGFAVRNWFVLGTSSTYFVELVTGALVG